MISIFKDIKSDKINTIRYVNSLFITFQKVSIISKEINLNRKFQYLKDKYLSNFKRILNSINSNNDIRIDQINNEINQLNTYILNIICIFKVSKSEYFLKDIIQKFLEFLENRISELLKLDIYKIDI